MGIVAGLLFFGGLVVCIPLIIIGISMHRSFAKSKGQGGAWLLFILTSIVSAIAMAGMGVLYVINGVSSGGAPTGNDYLTILIFATVLGLSPGLGPIMAAILLNFIKSEKEEG